jgi:hypothetical protein
MRVLSTSRALDAGFRSDDRRTIHTHTAPYHSVAVLHSSSSESRHGQPSGPTVATSGLWPRVCVWEGGWVVVGG